MVIHNFSDIENTIALRFECDEWYIDDFSPSDDGEDDKAYLRRTIKGGKEAHEKAKMLAGSWGWVGKDSPELLLDMEMTAKGLRAKQCDVYRMYGFWWVTVPSATVWPARDMMVPSGCARDISTIVTASSYWHVEASFWQPRQPLQNRMFLPTSEIFSTSFPADLAPSTNWSASMSLFESRLRLVEIINLFH